MKIQKYRIHIAIITITIASLCLFSPLYLQAEELDGRLFLGEGLSINLLEKESFFQELLRYLNLRTEPRKLINISELGAKGDNIFIGEDMKLYFNSEKKHDAAYCIGEARRLWQFKLDNDVKLAKVKECNDLFSSKKGSSLKLRVKVKSDRKREKKVKQAGFQFWLEELVYEYDSYSEENSTDENYPYICNAIKSTLPASKDAPPQAFENLKLLKEFTDTSPGIDLIPFRDIINEMIDKALKNKAPNTLIKEYSDIKETILKKTEGL